MANIGNTRRPEQIYERIRELKSQRNSRFTHFSPYLYVYLFIHVMVMISVLLIMNTHTSTTNIASFSVLWTGALFLVVPAFARTSPGARKHNMRVRYSCRVLKRAYRACRNGRGPTFVAQQVKKLNAERESTIDFKRRACLDWQIEALSWVLEQP